MLATHTLMHCVPMGTSGTVGQVWRRLVIERATMVDMQEQLPQFHRQRAAPAFYDEESVARMLAAGGRDCDDVLPACMATEIVMKKLLFEEDSATISESLGLTPPLKLSAAATSH